MEQLASESSREVAAHTLAGLGICRTDLDPEGVRRVCNKRNPPFFSSTPVPGNLTDD